MKLAATPLLKPPPIPNKMEVIPIHTSDRATFKRCRRKWNWSSPMRESLTLNAEFHQTDLNLWFGTGVHYGLQKFYDPGLQRDPIETFISWWEFQWNGGIVLKGPDEKEGLEMSPDPKPLEKRIKLNPDADVLVDVYQCRGLRDILPDPDPAEFQLLREMGIAMLAFYKEYSAEHDNFTVLMAEHTFSVPLGFTAIDPRDGKEKEVHYRGTQDAIVQDNESGRFGILEHKTAARIDDAYFRKLEKDEQCTSYLWSAEVEAQVHDLEYDQMDFVIYNALRKAYPKPPTETKSGMFSIDRQKESTTWPMLQQFIEERGLWVVVEADPKLKNYVEYVRTAGNDQFIDRRITRRNRAEIQSADWRIKAEARDMLRIPIGYNDELYPNPTGDWTCLNCIFRPPCIGYDDGSDWEMMIEDNYVKQSGR